MNTVWEVEEPINIWHDSWICLHNWCGNLNWIIIASRWTFRPLSLPHYFTHPLYPAHNDASLKTKHVSFTVISSHSHTRTNTRSHGRRQTINVISGCDWHMALMNPLGSVSLCLPLCSWLTAVPPLSYTHAHTHTLGALTVSDIMLLSSVVQRWHTLCLMLMSNSLSNDCVRACVWEKERKRDGETLLSWNTVTCSLPVKEANKRGCGHMVLFSVASYKYWFYHSCLWESCVLETETEKSPVQLGFVWCLKILWYGEVELKWLVQWF